jgi:hypothetical protein
VQHPNKVQSSAVDVDVDAAALVDDVEAPPGGMAEA